MVSVFLSAQSCLLYTCIGFPTHYFKFEEVIPPSLVVLKRKKNFNKRSFVFNLFLTWFMTKKKKILKNSMRPHPFFSKRVCLTPQCIIFYRNQVNFGHQISCSCALLTNHPIFTLSTWFILVGNGIVGLVPQQGLATFRHVYPNGLSVVLPFGTTVLVLLSKDTIFFKTQTSFKGRQSES